MEIRKLLEDVQQGKVSIDEAYKSFQSYEDLGFAKVDLHRSKRKGFPEVIFGQGKTNEHLVSIFKKLQAENQTTLATRVTAEVAEVVCPQIPHVHYHELARCLTWISPEQSTLSQGYIAVVCAGTSDLPVAEEAAVTAETMGSEVKRIYDVGVAGIHRLFDQIEVIQRATVIIVVAGMEGALASVVGGLVSKPILAVPTSIGYGANFQGLSALLTMLNSCASGVSVVNIDNGFGAAYSAVLIHRQSKGEV